MQAPVRPPIVLWNASCASSRARMVAFCDDLQRVSKQLSICRRELLGSRSRGSRRGGNRLGAVGVGADRRDCDGRDICASKLRR